jgi:uncharacterized OB-fold protein
MTVARPLPEETALTAPFWEAARERRLVIQRCQECEQYRWPPEVACYECGSMQYGWAPVSGRATLYTWTIAHPPLLPYFQQRSPWPVAVVELEEGPRLVTNLVEIEPGAYGVGLPLDAAFEDIGDDVTLVVFRPSGQPAAP